MELSSSQKTYIMHLFIKMNHIIFMCLRLSRSYFNCNCMVYSQTLEHAVPCFVGIAAPGTRKSMKEPGEHCLAA